MAGSTKKQHFVPQFYLNEFADASHQLYVFDKYTLNSYKARVQDVAQKRYFYDFPDQESIKDTAEADHNATPDSQIVENALSKLEGNYAAEFRAIRQTIKDRKPLSTNEKYIISHFIAIQFQRTPTYRKLFTEVYEKGIAKLWEKTQKDAPPVQVKFDPDQLPLEHAALMFNPHTTDRIVQILMNHIWMIGINEGDNPLYTSDQPITKMSRSGPRGFGSPGIEIALPLTPEIIVLLSDRESFLQLVYAGYEDTYINLNKEDVKHYNSLQVSDSERQVYCSTGDFLFAVEICAEHPEMCQPRKSHIEVF